MQLNRTGDRIEIHGSNYHVVFDRIAMLVRLRSLQGPLYYHQSMISAIDVIDCVDVTTDIADIRARDEGEKIVVEIELTSRLWKRKLGVYVCEEDRVSYHVRVEGNGRIDRVYFFRGGFRENQLASVPGFDFVYPACTNFLEKELFHASEYTSISAGHESFAWGYALASGPLCFALGDEGGDSWLSVGLVPTPQQWGFQSFEFNHRPAAFLAEPDAIVGTQAFSITYYGHETANGRWETPSLVMQFAANRHAAVEAYVDHLYSSGALIKATSDPQPAWWARPIFCGWHEQMSLGFSRDETRLSRNYLETGARAQAACTQANYERWLKILDERGCRPGTVMIDALWQVAPDVNEVDPAKWPDLRGFIDACHGRNQRVLLWVDLWKHRSLPDDECAVQDGKPVCADPTNPKYLARLGEEIRFMLSDAQGCLNADGFKIDGQTLQPYGYNFSTRGGVYGFALQRAIIEFIYRNAKRAKPDALISLFSANPYFADICDMVRLGDLYTVRGDPISTMRRRARLIRTGMPGKLIDTDGAFRFNLTRPMQEILDEQVKLGIPTIYNASAMTAHRVFCQPIFEEWNSDRYRAIATAFAHCPGPS